MKTYSTDFILYKRNFTVENITSREISLQRFYINFKENADTIQYDIPFYSYVIFEYVTEIMND